jgi:hypothetical protein
MFVFTDIPEAPWYVTEADDKRRARINMITHLLENLPYEHVDRPTITLPPRPPAQDYQRPPRELFHQVPDRAEQLVADAPSETGKKQTVADKPAAKAGGKKARSGAQGDHAQARRLRPMIPGPRLRRREARRAAIESARLWENHNRQRWKGP